MKIVVRTQTPAERRATSVGTTRSIIPRTDLIGPGSQLTFVRPTLGNVAGPRRLPDAIWTDKK